MEDITFRRLRWAGHIIRMEEQRIPKRILNGNFHTATLEGRPRTTWADVVQRDDQQQLGITGWRSKAAKKEEWRRLMRKAKARKGVQRNTWMDGWMDGYNTIGIHYIVRRNKITSSNSVNFLFVSTLRLCLSSRLKIGLFQTIFKDPISTDQ